jgi:hypothetical protein
LIQTSTCQLDPSQYGFENEIEIWAARTHGDSQAVSTIGQSKKGTAKFGCYSLELVVDLAGGHKSKSKGEAYVDINRFPPSGITAPINLEGIQITAWVYMPNAAVGDRNNPNGVQVFVKDQNGKGEYGSWFDSLDYTDRWIPIRLIPSKEPPQNGFMDNGFDPTKIVEVGIKIGAGANSTATYAGPIYVDGVNW